MVNDALAFCFSWSHIFQVYTGVHVALGEQLNVTFSTRRTTESVPTPQIYECWISTADICQNCTCAKKTCRLNIYYLAVLISSHHLSGSLAYLIFVTFFTYRISMWRNFSTYQMWLVCDVENASTFAQFMLFVVKSVLLQIMHFCHEICLCRNLRTSVWREVEPKNCLHGEKITNIRYVPWYT